MSLNKGYRVYADLHTHTYYSHGTGSPRENVLAAIEKGLERICVSEHGPGHFTFGVRGKKLEKLNNEMLMLKKEYENKIEVLRGLELNVTGFGRSDCPDNRDDYDVIIIGYHKSVAPTNRFARHIWGESLLGVGSDPRRNAEGILAAAEACRANIISHPGLYLAVDVPYMAKCCRELGILMEVNSSRVTLSNDELLSVKEADCGLIIGSDAHSPDRVGDFKLASSAVEEAGVWELVRNAKMV